MKRSLVFSILMVFCFTLLHASCGDERGLTKKALDEKDEDIDYDEEDVNKEPDTVSEYEV